MSLRALIESRRTERFITALILLNAVTLGLETVPAVMDRMGPLLLAFDRFVIMVFIVDRAQAGGLQAVLLPPAVEHLRFRDRRHCAGTGSGGLPGSARPQGPAHPAHDHRGSVAAPGGGSTRHGAAGHGLDLPAARAHLLYFLGHGDQAVRGLVSRLVRHHRGLGLLAVPDHDPGELVEGIVRPVMTVYPYAWAFFVPFILCATFIALNLFIGVIVSAIQGEHEQLLKQEHLELEQERRRLVGKADAARDATHDDTVTLGHEIMALRQESHELRAGLGLPARSRRSRKG